MLDAFLQILSGMFMAAGVMILLDFKRPRRERCYFCWRRSWGHASVSAQAKPGGTTWTVTRYHCRLHTNDALDLAAGTSSRLATTPAKKTDGGAP